MTTLTAENNMPDIPALPPDPTGLGRVDTVEEVLGRLDAIQAFAEATSPLGDQDGVASFNFLYRIITQRVLDRIQEEDFFPDEEFLTRLDVAFANRYFDALRSHATGRETPRSWKVLFERRSKERITPLQFAVAGVNAHVNFDLSCAVVETCEELGRKPDAGTQEESYDKVNAIFAEQMEQLRQHFEGRLALWIDKKVLGSVDDILGNWSVEASRAHAWKLATLLWTVRRHDSVKDATLEIQDRASGLAGHLLLLRLP